MSDNKPVIVATVGIDELAAAIVAATERQNRPNPEKLYTRAQAARLMGKKYDTIDRMILQGRLKATTDGKYISQRAIDNYLNAE